MTRHRWEGRKCAECGVHRSGNNYHYIDAKGWIVISHKAPPCARTKTKIVEQQGAP